LERYGQCGFVSTPMPFKAPCRATKFQPGSRLAVVCMRIAGHQVALGMTQPDSLQHLPMCYIVTTHKWLGMARQCPRDIMMISTVRKYCTNSEPPHVDDMQITTTASTLKP
jgi:hypothetical protein